MTVVTVVLLILRIRHEAHSAARGYLQRPSRYSAQACLRICTEDVRKIPAISAATPRSGQAVAVPHTPAAAIITTTLPIASLREHSQTERTLASPSLYGINSSTLPRLAARASEPMPPINSARGRPSTKE